MLSYVVLHNYVVSGSVPLDGIFKKGLHNDVGMKLVDRKYVKGHDTCVCV